MVYGKQLQRCLQVAQATLVFVFLLDLVQALRVLQVARAQLAAFGAILVQQLEGRIGGEIDELALYGRHAAARVAPHAALGILQMDTLLVDFFVGGGQPVGGLSEHQQRGGA